MYQYYSCCHGCRCYSNNYYCVKAPICIKTPFQQRFKCRFLILFLGGREKIFTHCVMIMGDLGKNSDKMMIMCTKLKHCMLNREKRFTEEIFDHSEKHNIKVFSAVHMSLYVSLVDPGAMPLLAVLEAPSLSSVEAVTDFIHAAINTAELYSC